MKKIYLALLLSSILLFTSCSDDTGTLNVTYFEAEAIYGNLEAIRTQEINETVRQILNPGKIYVAKNLILVGEEENGIHVIDNTNSASPTAVNFISVPGNREFYVNGDYLYAESYYDVVKIDISNPSNAVLAARAENVFADNILNENGEALLGFTFHEVAREVDENSDLFAVISNGNVVYLDFAKNIIPRSAVPASFAGNSNESSGTVNRMTYHTGHVYIVGRYDLNIIKDDDNFHLVTQRKNVGDEMETIFPYKDKLFIGSRSSMEIFDVSEAANPVHEFRFDHATSCDPVLPKGNAAYISLRTADFSGCPGNTNALVVLDIENLENPEEVDEIQMRSPYGMALIGNHLFVGEGENGITIFDATDPLQLIEYQHIEEIEAFDVIEHPTRSDLILIAGPNGLEQYIMDDGLRLELESRVDF